VLNTIDSHSQIDEEVASINNAKAQFLKNLMADEGFPHESCKGISISRFHKLLETCYEGGDVDVRPLLKYSLEQSR